MAEKEIKKRTKKPTAQKRRIQDEKKRLRNKVLKSRIKTAVKQYDEIIKGSEKANSKQKLGAVFSLIDKALKTGIFKKNKVSRIKSKLALRAK